MGKICAFFGHDCIFNEKEYEPILRQQIINLYDKEGVDTFYVGTHGHFDNFAYQTVIEVQRNYRQHIKIIHVMAYASELTDYRYDKMPMNDFIYPEELVTTPYRLAIVKRNQFVVKHCDFIICYVDVDYGGAYKTCLQALRKKIPIINICKGTKIMLSTYPSAIID